MTLPAGIMRLKSEMRELREFPTEFSKIFFPPRFVVSPVYKKPKRRRRRGYR